MACGFLFGCASESLPPRRIPQKEEQRERENASENGQTNQKAATEGDGVRSGFCFQDGIGLVNARFTPGGRHDVKHFVIFLTEDPM